MKSEHRHELQTNDLAKSLMTFPDYVREYGGRVALGLAIVVLAAVLITQRTTRATPRLSATATTSPSPAPSSIASAAPPSTSRAASPSTPPTAPSATSSRRLRDIRDNASDKAVVAQALLAQADLAWALGNFPQPSTASTQPAPKLEKERPEFLNDAKTNYQQLITQYADQTVPVLAAHFGLAAVAENARNWDEARKEYEAVKNDPNAIDAYKRSPTSSSRPSKTSANPS